MALVMLLASASALGIGYWAAKKAPPAAESGEEVGAAGAAFGAGAGSPDAARAGGGAEACAGAGGPAAGAGSPTGAGGGGEGAATTDAGAGAMLAGGGAGGSSRRPALGGGRGRKSFPRTCGRRGFVSRWLRRLCLFPLRISRRPGRGDSPAASGGADGRGSAHCSSASGFARPDELRGFSAGAGDDKALTDFGFEGIFAVFAARQPSKCSAPARLPPVRACPAIAGGAFRGSPPRRRPRSSGAVAFARRLSVLPRMFGMKRSQSTPGEDPVPVSSL